MAKDDYRDWFCSAWSCTANNSALAQSSRSGFCREYARDYSMRYSRGGIMGGVVRGALGGPSLEEL